VDQKWIKSFNAEDVSWDESLDWEYQGCDECLVAGL
jgi:hypothetical protein